MSRGVTRSRHGTGPRMPSRRTRLDHQAGPSSFRGLASLAAMARRSDHSSRCPQPVPCRLPRGPPPAGRAPLLARASLDPVALRVPVRRDLAARLHPRRLAGHLRVVRRVVELHLALLAPQRRAAARGRRRRRRCRPTGRRRPPAPARRTGGSSRGSVTSASSSHVIGVETGAPSSGRREYAEAMVRSRLFWLKSTKIRSPRSSFHQSTVTWSSRRASSRPKPIAAWRTSVNSQLRPDPDEDVDAAVAAGLGEAR